MDLIEAKQALAQVRDAVSSNKWDYELISAVQRALAELYLLNPDDDVDGALGQRTRGAWRFFKEAAQQPNPDTLERDSADQLLQALNNPASFVGQAKVGLEPPFEFHRGSKHQESNKNNSAKAIMDASKARQLSNAQIAYILATAEHESDSFGTLEEYSDGSQYERRADLGNTQLGDGPRFKGRGYVQLTGRLNYSSYARATGIELVKLPIILMNWPALSVFVIVDGMMTGAYTGRRLDEFVKAGKQDFYNARQVVNGHDRADKIERLAHDWLTAVK